MPFKVKETTPGNYTISCEHCGKPITKTSDFGMDCKDDCAQRKYNKRVEAGDPSAMATELLRNLLGK